MDGSNGNRLAGRLGRGTLTSVLVHAMLLFPLVTAAYVFGAREKAQREDEVELSFEQASPDELPLDLPPLEPDLPPPAPEEKAKKPKEALAKEAPPEPEKAARPPEPKPPEEVTVPPPKELPPIAQEKPPEPPQPKPERQKEKMVDLDNDKEVEAPKDAKYLAQKNNRVDEETRATDTNLERNQKGTQGSSPSDRQDPQVGDDENKIAELEDQKSKLGRAAPAVTPHVDPQLSAGQQERKSILSMRSETQRAHEITPETADSSLPRDPEGMRHLPFQDLKSVRNQIGQDGKAGKVRLSLTGAEMEYLFGADAAAAERLAQKERSKRQGKFATRLGRIQSSLENFIPEVKPGNQTALNTRAAPFAAYIARMHRSIHKLWGFGFLEELDGKPTNSPYNNPALVTKLEIVLNGDGTIDKVTVVRSSGYTPFDVAAVDVAYSAGPYPDPPREIRSGNGKIYIHWNFHRDERQCATSGVDYYILDNAPPGADKGTASEGEPTRGLPGEFTPRPGGPKRLEREIPDTAAHRAKMRELDRAAGMGEHAHHEHEEHDHDAQRRASEKLVRAEDAGARAVSDQWFDAYAKGDLARMLRQAAFPFRSSEGVVAKTEADLRRVLQSLLEEAPKKRSVSALQVYTPAGARGLLGGLPSGLGETQGRLFAVGHVGGDTFVLVLAADGGQWRAVGLMRR